MSKLPTWMFGDLHAEARAQALRFERLRAVPAAAAGKTVRDVIAAVSDAGAPPVFRAGDVAFGLSDVVQRRHALIEGATDTGKTTALHQLLVSRIARSAARVAAAGGDLDATPLDVELFAVDPKDDGPRVKMRFAALYLTSSRPVQRVLRGAFASIEWQRARGGAGRVTPTPLFARNDAVSPEYQAALIVEVIVTTAPGEWTDSIRFLFFIVVRLFLRKGFAFDPIAIEETLTNDAFRLSLVDGLPPDLADLVGRLPQIVAPQTIAALLRRLRMLVAYPEVQASMCLPPSAVRGDGAKPVRVTIADCGTRSALPSEIGHAQAHALLAADSLDVGTRDARVPKIQLIEEFRTLFSESAVLRARHIENLRTARSAGVSVWFAAQSLDGLPASDQEEIRTNTGLSLTFRSQSAARVLYPHILTDADPHGREPERRAAFQREVESLAQRELILWTKTEPAIRVRAIDAPDPVRATGVPEDELTAVFDEVLAPNSTIAVATAERLLSDWRAATLRRSAPPAAPGPRAARGKHRTAPATDGPSLRSILGLPEREP